MMVTRKIDALVGADDVAFTYGNTFEREAVRGGERLRIGLDSAQDLCFRELAAGLIGPFQLLYVLHTTRIGSQLGRYESPILAGDQVRDFLGRFGGFLSQDSRHDVWLRSHDDDGTIVLDRHNVIYAYGPLRAFEEVLERIGAKSRGLPRIPDPHVHHYHAEWDESERAVLEAVPWTRRPLQTSDVQFEGDGPAG